MRNNVPELRRKPVVWINVTTSANWTRPPVGIVRVERALAEYLQQALGSDDCKLCIWQDDQFIEWIAHSAAKPTAAVVQATDVILPRSAAFDLARPFVMRALRRFASANDAARAQDSVQVTVPLAAPSRLRPVRGDFVLSVGLDWDNQYTEKFYDLSQRNGLRFITCCYDLIPVLFPHYCVGEVAQRFTEYFIQLSWGSEAVLCISRQTQSDYVALCKEIGAPQRKTVVIPLGDSVPSGGAGVGVQVEGLAKKPFILFVSTIERRKNHEVLYRAYHLLARRGLKASLPTLVFVGMPGWGVGDLLKDIEIDPLTKGLIVQLHHVSDAELNHLYQHASFCVYPSLYEGWGLPVGEALAMGKAVIASAEGSLPEVGDALVRYVSPWDAYAWADTMLEFINQPEMVGALEDRVRASYRPREWKDTAAVIIELVKELERDAPPATVTLFPGYAMSTAAGIHVGPSIQASGQAGLLLFGPHWHFTAGSYEVRMWASMVEPVDQSFVLEIAVDGGKRLISTTDVKCAGPFQHTMIASIAMELPQDIDDLEFRCFVGQGCGLLVERIEVRALRNPALTVSSPPEQRRA